MKFSLAFTAALVASASAFSPSPSFTRPASMRLFSDRYGKYDEQVWDITSKTDVYNSWDPNQPRSPMNFNPFETWEGNSPDANGRYPGEAFYKDPIRGDMNWEIMQLEQRMRADREANPKPGDRPGAPGCKN